MIPLLTGIPVILTAVLLQSAVVSQIQLLNGAADLVLLTFVSWTMNERVEHTWGWAVIAGLAVGFVSELPVWLMLIAYLLTAGVGLALRGRIWQVPFLALLAAVLLGTLILHTLTFLLLRLQATPVGLSASFNLITLPTLLLNLIFALPIHAVVNELVHLVYPESPDA